MSPAQIRRATLSPIILVTGGARSGKSAHAETRARAFPGQRHYIATCRPGNDHEMHARIARHVNARGEAWVTVEEPFDLVGALERSDGRGPRLIDCLTLWLANLMFDDRPWQPEAEALVAALAGQRSPVVLVSNEVGMGIVPENALARAFRDAQGWLNQCVAGMADEAEFVVSGLPLRLK
ncbi:bifunctional adenosylcobinamide kinase/adenosylcobinamide-phosphate guanylyltransferase (plasmid) [Cereibacter azotoformans]|uniref:bifunctional adenosylcobinamide kinase/adenosylcobinamide-phosphate guanylyltransferase n=1 Tax=Cereibacter azotoformans TaxID=43057 RepID=UPI001EEBC5E7|nr:bifunctional adenosylcobinamide kinase/adenosylcobinamide-phosphate guanylyltransferase [Cereibacter azotoformans]ULB12367.1 bifunctional adenosylcobinamide kinase/adenosylcobinamide-phosphate guanylyltransferase [Cereibacter azotoformans]